MTVRSLRKNPPVLLLPGLKGLQHRVAPNRQQQKRRPRPPGEARALRSCTGDLPPLPAPGQLNPAQRATAPLLRPQPASCYPEAPEREVDVAGALPGSAFQRTRALLERERLPGRITPASRGPYSPSRQLLARCQKLPPPRRALKCPEV